MVSIKESGLTTQLQTQKCYFNMLNEMLNWVVKGKGKVSIANLKCHKRMLLIYFDRQRSYRTLRIVAGENSQTYKSSRSLFTLNCPTPCLEGQGQLLYQSLMTVRQLLSCKNLFILNSHVLSIPLFSHFLLCFCFWIFQKDSYVILSIRYGKVSQAGNHTVHQVFVSNGYICIKGDVFLLNCLT